MGEQFKTSLHVNLNLPFQVGIFGGLFCFHFHGMNLISSSERSCIFNERTSSRKFINIYQQHDKQIYNVPGVKSLVIHHLRNLSKKSN